jgi:hypothetical protein
MGDGRDERGSGAGFAGWPALLAEQIDWLWRTQARPRLDGLADEEYRWEPVPGAWNVRPRGEPPGRAAVAVGSGAGVIDFAFDPPDPTPLTTIAWRLSHLVVGVLGDRNARYFGGAPISYDTYDYPLTAAGALADLDAGYARWVAGVRSMDESTLLERCDEPGHETDPMAALVLHIHRELIHHLAEVALLRDLWANGGQRAGRSDVARTGGARTDAAGA